jgi:hypothetical protein
MLVLHSVATEMAAMRVDRAAWSFLQLLFSVNHKKRVCVLKIFSRNKILLTAFLLLSSGNEVMD